MLELDVLRIPHSHQAIAALSCPARDSSTRGGMVSRRCPPLEASRLPDRTVRCRVGRLAYVQY